MRPADSMYLTVGIELKYGQMFLITTHAELKYKKNNLASIIYYWVVQRSESIILLQPTCSKNDDNNAMISTETFKCKC